MEYFDTAEAKEQVRSGNFDYSQGMSAQNGLMHSFNHASSEAEDRADEAKITSFFPALFGSPWHWKSQTPLRSPPVADVKVAVMNPGILQPKICAVSKKGPPFFSVSSFYNPGGDGYLQKSGSLKGLEAFLRMAAAAFSLIACCVMTSAHETRVAAGSTFEVKFSDFQAYNYLVALNVLAFMYSSAQVVVIWQSNSSSSVFGSPVRSRMCKYFCDEILAFCLLSASSSAATASQLASHGLRNIWPPACSTWKLWMLCSKADAAVVIGFLSSLSVILSSLCSGAQLLQLAALV